MIHKLISYLTEHTALHTTKTKNQLIVFREIIGDDCEKYTGETKAMCINTDIPVFNEIGSTKTSPIT